MQVERIQLIKSIAMTIPIFVMQTFVLPKSILYKIESQIQKFFWGFKDDQSRHIYDKAWSAICLPKTNGGLGLRTLYNMNLSLMTRMAWNVQTQGHKLWVNLIKAKYLRGRQILDEERTTS